MNRIPCYRLVIHTLSLLVPAILVCQTDPGRIDQDRLRRDLTFLSSDSLKGRAAGTPENLVAAYYIAREFKAAGLKPMPNQRPVLVLEDTSAAEGFDQADSLSMYFQRFTLVRSRLSEENELNVATALPRGSVKSRFNTPTDFYVQYSGQTGIMASAPVAFCGFGIEAGPNGYNDFKQGDGKEIDLAGKFALVIDGYPGQEDSTSLFRKNRKPTYMNNLRKAESAKARGAIALLVVEPRRDGVASFEQRYSSFKQALHRENFLLASRVEANIPVVFITRKVARDLFANTDASLDSLFRLMEQTLKPNPFELRNKTIELTVRFNVAPVEMQNVVGILPGSDSLLAKEFLVIGGHFDHVGLGYHGSMSKKFAGQIHNGADDNGSGTVGVMELARVLSGAALKRSVVFMAFTAEELGLLGSAYYVTDQPIAPLKNTIAMLNLDMIGRNEDSLLWVGGAFYSTDMRMIAERANKEVGFNLLYNTGLLNMASDQAGFLRRQIPASFFFAGLHDDYHTPADDIEKINFEKMGRVIRLAANAATIIANDPGRPRYEELPMNDRMKLVQESLVIQRRFRPQPEKK